MELHELLLPFPLPRSHCSVPVVYPLPFQIIPSPQYDSVALQLATVPLLRPSQVHVHRCVPVLNAKLFNTPVLQRFTEPLESISPPLLKS